ncbi:VWA containing CoxE family protein [Delftia sp. GW456-R20]|uniref:VWA domain-containing protein n=1 Tax=Delftia sp. GW456-R20 TaxID=1827145 RepID=UPI0007AEB8D5|nr:VWA domain-containing protein [Delftia sp. GW456-R20]KZK31568.1 VWA containing CoxE family protein [Delftia sp. GW456-R20]
MQEQAIDAATLRRWRLILGPEAAQPLAAAQPLDDADARRDAALDYLYQREHRLREQPDGAGTDAWQGGGGQSARQGGSGVPEPQAVHWLGEVRDLFPRSAVETLQRDALSRYGLHGLLSDPQVLAEATPSIELVAALMAVRTSLPPEVLAEARRLVARVVADLQARLSSRVHSALGRRRRRSSRGQGQMSDLDWPRTLRHNLRHYQSEEQVLVLERLFFRENEAQRLTWDLWLVVDQSGSMHESVIHSAVMGSIFARVRALRTHVLLFSDAVADVTGQLHAPEELLLGAQLGGGTNIGAALAHVAGQLAAPRRSVIVLITDLYEGHDEARVIAETERLVASGARVLVLAALDRRAHPDYDRDLAAQLVARGAQVAAMTPDHLVDWLARAMQGSRPS